MKRFLTSLATLLVVAALSVVPVFAQDAGSTGGTNAGATSSSSGAVATPVDLSAWFTSEQLALLSVDEQKILVDKLNALASDPVAFKKKVEAIRSWMDERLIDLKKKAEREARHDEKFENKLDKEFARLMREKKDALEHALRMQEKEERMKRMEAKRALAQARRFSKPKVLQGWVASVDAANGVIVLKKEGAQAKVLINAKTVFAVVEDDGARTGTLADFQAGDRIFGLVRRNPNDHSLVGVVLVKMPAQERGGDDEDETPAPPPAPPTDPVPPPADPAPPAA